MKSYGYAPSPFTAETLIPVALLGIFSWAVDDIGMRGGLPQGMQEFLHNLNKRRYPLAGAPSSKATAAPKPATPGTPASGAPAGGTPSTAAGTPAGYENRAYDLLEWNAPGFAWDHGVVYNIEGWVPLGNASSPPEAAKFVRAWLAAHPAGTPSTPTIAVPSAPAAPPVPIEVPIGPPGPQVIDLSAIDPTVRGFGWNQGTTEVFVIDPYTVIGYGQSQDDALHVAITWWQEQTVPDYGAGEYVGDGYDLAPVA